MENKNINNLYFIDGDKYNCAICQTKSVGFNVVNVDIIDETKTKQLLFVVVKCNNCNKKSFHLLKVDKELEVIITKFKNSFSGNNYDSTIAMFELNQKGPLAYTTEYFSKLIKNNTINLEDYSIMHIPPVSRVIDDDIPRNYRDLLGEAITCKNNNALTGASACIRKIIYELTKGIEEDHYDKKLDKLREKHPDINTMYIKILKDMASLTSIHLHENDFENLASNDIATLITVLEKVLIQAFVVPKDRDNEEKEIYALIKNQKDKKSK